MAAVASPLLNIKISITVHHGVLSLCVNHLKNRFYHVLLHVLISGRLGDEIVIAGLIALGVEIPHCGIETLGIGI